MRWLITGGAGFIGTRMALRRASAGDTVTVLDNLTRPGVAEHNLPRLLDAGVQMYEYDVRHQDWLRHAVRQCAPDVVLHLAGQVAVTTSVEDPLGDHEVNVQGTLNLLEAVRRHAPEAVVLFASSNKVYGHVDPFPWGGVDERQPVRPASPYGVSKAAADWYCLDYARTYGLRTVVFRQSCIAGPGQIGVEDQGWLAWFARRIAAGEPITLFGSGHQRRDVLHVDDCCRAYEAAVERIERVAGEAFNLGGGLDHVISLRQAIEALGCRPHGTPTVEQAPARNGDQLDFWCDITKARALLDWHPCLDLQHVLADVWRWARKHTESLTAAA